MSKIPRLLPLVGVAIGGVIAANALGGAHALPGLLSATQAAAEEALHPAKSGKHGKAAITPDPAAAPGPKTDSALPPGAAAAPVAAPVCATSATDLAKAAGMSPAELQVLQSLQTRRGQIDDREKDLDTEIQLLAAAEAKLDGKLKSMDSLKADIQALMGQADQKTQGEVDRLTVVYSKMKPQDAAAVMAQLDDKVRLPIAATMKPAVLSAILGKMGTLEAKDLTEKLAHRFAPVQALAQAAIAPPAATPSAAATTPAKGAPAKDKGKPAPAAADKDPAATDEADAAPADKANPAKKPAAKKRVAKVAPKKAPPPQAKPPAANAKADAPALPAKPQPYTAAAPAPAAAVAPAKSS